MLLCPTLYKRLTPFRVPILLQIFVALLPESGPQVVAKPALKRHEARAVQLAQAVTQKAAAVLRILLKRNAALAAPECGRQHAECQLRSNLEHHAAAIARGDRFRSLLDRPPAGALAIAAADIAAARLARRIFLLQSRNPFDSRTTSPLRSQIWDYYTSVMNFRKCINRGQYRMPGV